MKYDLDEFDYYLWLSPIFLVLFTYYSLVFALLGLTLPGLYLILCINYHIKTGHGLLYNLKEYFKRD